MPVQARLPLSMFAPPLGLAEREWVQSAPGRSATLRMEQLL
jgi:hypothetical protein